MKTRFDGLQKECNNQTENLARVTAAQHYSDAALHFEQTGKLLKAERNLKFKAWIGAPNYEMDFRRADKKRYKDTCRWILDKDPYKSWESSPTGQLHVVYGIPGAGKTILSSFLVKEARSKLQPGSPNPSGTVLYHYFKGDDETKSTATTAVRSLLRQLYEFYLLNSVADALSDLETALYSTAHKATPDFDDVWKIFHGSLTSSNTFPTTIVLDAIEECQKPKPFIRVLHELVTTNYDQSRCNRSHCRSTRQRISKSRHTYHRHVLGRC